MPIVREEKNTRSLSRSCCFFSNQRGRKFPINLLAKTRWDLFSEASRIAGYTGMEALITSIAESAWSSRITSMFVLLPGGAVLYAVRMNVMSADITRKSTFPESSSSIRSTCLRQSIWICVSGAETGNGQNCAKFRRRN